MQDPHRFVCDAAAIVDSTSGDTETAHTSARAVESHDVEVRFDAAAVHEAIEAVGEQSVLELGNNMIAAVLADLDKLHLMSDVEARHALHAMRGAAACCGASGLAQLAGAKYCSSGLSLSDIQDLRQAALGTRDLLLSIIRDAADNCVTRRDLALSEPELPVPGC